MNGTTVGWPAATILEPADFAMSPYCRTCKLPLRTCLPFFESCISGS